MVNYFVLQGRLVADPELKTLQSGTSVCSFRVAWSEKIKETENKLFMQCSAWGARGETISKHFAKGKEIIVQGKVTQREYTDKDGNKRQAYEMTVEQFAFTGSKGEEAAPAKVQYDAPSADDSDLPF